jgi:TetR/AcrR family transcriptional regulator, mexJK operon transcriptional repressor
MAQAYLDIVLSRDGVALYRITTAEAPRFPEPDLCFYLTGSATKIDMVADTRA